MSGTVTAPEGHEAGAAQGLLTYRSSKPSKSWSCST
jgi:hypothetical protein